ncbi:MAG: phytoene desaturase family protein [Spirochaetales bacterium]
MKQHALIIGAGYAGLSSALLLLRDGWEVTVLDNNEGPGGRARLWSEKGYHFDMGPSWYLMPEVFDKFFSSIGIATADALTLTKLKTHYKVFFEGHDAVRITDDLDATKKLFDTFQPGGGQLLTDYMTGAQEKYDIAVGSFLYKEYKSVFDFFNWQVMTQGLKIGIFQSLDKFVARFFTDRRAKQILEYAMVFLGTSPQDAPSMYSLMSHVDLKLGVFFPKGGMNGVAVAMADLVKKRGGVIHYKHDVKHLRVEGGQVTEVQTEKGTFRGDVVLNTGDYAYGETQLLDPAWQTYKQPYWDSRVVAPSMFIVYLGVKKALPGLEHHNLYFSADWNKHFDTIFKTPSWPENPCYYLSAITKTDTTMAPEGCENLFLLVPAAPGLSDPEEFRAKYLDGLLAHVEKTTGESFRDAIEVCRVFSQQDFARDYHAFQGTALGLSHTLFQTAVFRPALRSKKVKNLYYSGQYTHPGVGVPMTLIASDVVAAKITGARRA